MVPKIKAKYREMFGQQYAIEQLSGKQYRCRHCNEVFYGEHELINHIKRTNCDKAKKMSVPEENMSVNVTVIYTTDFKDELKRKYLIKKQTKR